jgi:hypothetical protein
LILTALLVALLQTLTACRDEQAKKAIAANETAAVAHLHSLSSDQVVFNTINNHFACTIAELAGLPGLIDKDLGSGQRNGYVFSVHCYPQTDLPAFDAWATPLQPGETGVNLYCTDETGVVRRTDRMLDLCRKAKPVD